MSNPFLYEVRIAWESDGYVQGALDWLRDKKWKSNRDWDIDMHGGRTAYTSFFFRDPDKALIMKLTLGGM